MKRPLVLPILCFLSGAVAADALKESFKRGVFLAALVFSLLLAVSLFLCFRRGKIFYVLFSLLFLSLGFMRYVSEHFPRQDDISSFIGEKEKEALVFCAVSGFPETRRTVWSPYVEFCADVREIALNGEEKSPRLRREASVSGRIIVKLFSEKERVMPGDRIIMSGAIKLPPARRNPGLFDYREYLARSSIRAVFYSAENALFMKVGEAGGIVFSLKRFLFLCREKARKAISGNLSGFPKELARSIVLGSRCGLSDEEEDCFIETGTMHILAVSGLHVGVVILLFGGIFGLFLADKRITFPLMVTLVLLYAFFAGGQPSALRAAVMFIFLTLGAVFERDIDVTDCLAFSALAITFVRPGDCLSAGFVLSYTAILSLVYVTPLADSLVGVLHSPKMKSFFGRLKRSALKLISLSLAAWVGTMPIIARYFNAVTPSVVVSNLVAVPLFPAILVLGLVVSVAGLLGPLSFLAFLPAKLFGAISGFFIGALKAVSFLPCSCVRVKSPSFFGMAVYYAALILAIAFFSRRGKRGGILLVFLLFSASFFLWREVASFPPKRTKVTFFDVGRGDAMLVELARGSRVLIDGGSGGARGGSDAGRAVVAPYLWKNGIRKLDCVFVTHGHEDHFGGLAYLAENFNIEMIIIQRKQSGPSEADDGYSRFLSLAVRKKIRIEAVEAGDIVTVGRGEKFFVLNPAREYLPGNANDSSLVLKFMTEGGASILFCGDILSDAIENLRGSPEFDCDVVKLPHHGGNLGEKGSAIKLIERTSPESVVVSGTEKQAINTALFDFIRGKNIAILPTFENGAVVLEENNGRFSLVKWK